MILNEKINDGNLLEKCQAWQTVISDHDDIAFKHALGNQVCNEILPRETRFQGASRVIVKSEVALILPTGFSSEEQIWPSLSFQDVIAKGHLGKPVYVPMDETGMITWSLFCATAINTHTEEIRDAGDYEYGQEEPEFGYYLSTDRPMQRPIFMPVSFIKYALVAA